ncbi:hypothetical protein B0H67DRAFT_591826 [Lasiosphaeris hirsuta]|uniref:Uncharacterized protein n=1 Tax=Lasiosphaeris hirsuta TaxID=260670 RepID=A0AA39ZVW9_9PEZI|nr:hypothetical protein B0H67DRAFT_591826 [Lasiosphaeris hirsuta]
MFEWYRKSHVCYVYLADMALSSNESATLRAFRKSRWFTSSPLGLSRRPPRLSGQPSLACQ